MFEKAQAHLASLGYEDRIQVFEVSSETVALAALAVGCPPEQIAKTLSFLVDGAAVLVVAAGDARVDNKKFKAHFHQKAVMLKPDQVLDLVGHEVGGVCPFGVKPGVQVYLDESLRRFDWVYPACGSGNSAVKLSPQELEQASGALSWVDLCRISGE